MKWLLVSLFALLALVAVYLLGPAPATPVYETQLPAVPEKAADLERYIRTREQQHQLKPDNEAQVIWYDSLHDKTPFSVVYLHGFSASRGEGDPVHRDFARKFGCNLFLSRLDGHGIDTTEPLLNMTATGLWRDAREALAIGKQLGHKVILVGTSTGSTLALKLAATFPKDVYAVINLSPNIAINNDLAFLANNHWGLQLARFVKKGNYNQSPGKSTLEDQYWYSKYRLEAVTQIQELLETTMTPATFAKVKQPVLDLYYYKDEAHQDPTVRVSAIKRMHGELGTPDSLKQLIDIPGAGAHVIGSSITSKAVPQVEQMMDNFAIKILKLKPVAQ
ncbi:alpha/beta fold hydrolase [Chitinophaga pendula]|uniref:alpha/beta hydrolase n=1 Tax=Chitinophaga TaxID=79328 RepID=UPI000BAF262A|nr:MULTISPECIES: alpha/beta fold hydrolase [Chitinophaga]ASZ13542.1 alpha/beta hydrolase [Chitinophaga sp. MD30]UCJ08825.1 alpha/beta fold hydrolase [Chitinophaga pendula]